MFLNAGLILNTFLFFFPQLYYLMTKIVDRAISSIGPVFIAIAVLLLDMCALAYYLVVFPYSHSLSDSSLLYKIYTGFILLFTLYMVYSIHFHYYMAIVTPPGDMKEYKKSAEEVKKKNNNNEKII